MHDHFTINQYNHTYFTINWGFTCDTGFNAWTRPRGVATQINGQTHWTDTIELNPCFLRKASKEKIVAVLMHETIHAYILWCIKEYNRTTPAGQGAVDSNYLKQHFPLHWEYLIAKPWNHNNAHELMARNYVRFIADVVFNHSNPNAPEELRRWLAMNLGASGLRNTSAWGNAQYLTDTCSILAIDLWSNRFQGWPNIINYQPGPGCPLTDTLFRDSLQMMKPEPCQ